MSGIEVPEITPTILHENNKIQWLRPLEFMLLKYSSYIPVNFKHFDMH